MIAERGGDYDVEVKGVEISPDPVVKRKLATFSISTSTGFSTTTRILKEVLQEQQEEKNIVINEDEPASEAS
ncbi:hypothetical protein MRB53_028341 [Persea americana]|uniref:Uncharacterized protein n=1 Tax=Persea americana TaxID=3435 RepID=A0ACC2KF65_PERAE|nr:hypothetical protein MRB53_028341 [Persea americana]